MAVSLVPRRRPGLLAVAQLAVALWLVAFTGCLCQPSYPTYPQPVPTYPTQPQPVPSYPTLPRESAVATQPYHAVRWSPVLAAMILAAPSTSSRGYTCI
ncbi:hypothetical protein PVAP13_1KG119985 [Panicum virgatum]|uniref:Uncharacterized protein n=1 Tax=Panicum virgatum TaxID=38727 RepID=A0A8T0X634_PANVG|nr:hypothetical protein PVAP13_1KG119985 [Panicum virgatum]